MTRTHHACVLAGALLLAGPTHAGAQATGFEPVPLATLRRAAALIPGEPPIAVGVITLAPRRSPLSRMVEVASTDSVGVGYAVFQVRFRRAWIVVDAGMGREFLQRSTTFSEPAYDTLQQALRDARTIVFTHEHHDHVAGALRSPFAAQVKQHALFTREQLRTLMEHPSDARVKLDSAAAAEWLSIDYQGWIPLATGVVLVKTRGHTPGSQVVYVRSASGRELLLSGDIAWHLSGVTEGRQKQPETSRALGEDRAALAPQLSWLRELGAAGVAVVVSHDDDSIADLVRRGTLVRGFDLRR